MKKPRLEDYGLTEETYKEAAAISDKALRRAAIMFWLVASLFLVWRIGAPTGLFEGALQFIVSGVVASPFFIIGSLVAIPLINRLYPKCGKATSYRDAVEAFKAWELRTERAFWLSLSGLAFEREIARLLARSGHKTTLTAATGDGGVDIWLENSDGKIAVQCKAHKKPLGPAAARELYGTMEHFAAKKGVLISRSGFSHALQEYVKGKTIQLMDLSDIVSMSRKLKG